MLFKYSREPFSTICPIGTSSHAFVRVIKIFTIVRAGFIRGEQQSICLTMISSCCLRQSLCFRDVYQALRRRPCFINTSATNLWRVYQLRTFKIIFTCFCFTNFIHSACSTCLTYLRFYQIFLDVLAFDIDRLWYFLPQCLWLQLSIFYVNLSTFINDWCEFQINQEKIRTVGHKIPSLIPLLSRWVCF